MLGEYLYRLAQQEARSAPVVQRVVRQVDSTPLLATTININPLFTVPLDKIFLLKNLHVNSLAGAGQTADRISVDITADNGATVLGRIMSNVQQVAGLRLFADRQFTDLVLMPLDALTVSGSYSAAANANDLTACLVGLLLPKGNVQLR